MKTIVRLESGGDVEAFFIEFLGDTLSHWTDTSGIFIIKFRSDYVFASRNGTNVPQKSGERTENRRDTSGMLDEV